MTRKTLPKETLVQSLKNPDSTHYAFVKNRGVDPKSIDWESLLDSSLDGSENWQIVQEEVKKRMSPEDRVVDEMPDEEEIEEINDRLEEKYIQEVEKQKKREIEEEFDKDETDVREFYGSMPDYVKGVAEGFRPAMMIEADPGIGKTYQITQILQETVGSDGFVKVQGVSSPMKFYQILYENKDKVVFVDDIEGLINNKRAQGILKQATWSATGSTKKVSWNSTSGKLEIPEEFDFEGQIIMCFNEIPQDDKIFQSLKDRCFFLELEMTYEEKIKLITEIAKNTGKKKHLEVPKEARTEIVEWLKVQTDSRTKGFNLRTFDDCIDLWRMEDNGIGEKTWKENAAEQIEVDKKLDKVYKLIKREKEGEFGTQEEAIEYYAEEMGKGKTAARREFFRKKKQLKSKSEVLQEIEE